MVSLIDFFIQNKTHQQQQASFYQAKKVNGIKEDIPTEKTVIIPFYF